MEGSNLQRMIALADEFFEAKNDTEQILVTEEVMDRLRMIHPATVSEETNKDGPVAWLLVIPTTHQVMEEFLAGTISESILLERTEPGMSYEALYLCSALVLPEHRGRGLARRLAVSAIRSIVADHPIKELYYWAFSEVGKKLAESLADEFKLPLFRRTD